MFRTLTTLSTLALLAIPALADGHASLSGFALAEEGTRLVMMPDISNPGAVEMMELDTPLAAIAYRPVTGDLIGYRNGAIYRIDPMTGDLSDLGAEFVADAMTADGASVAFDFNNKIDAVRAVSTAGDNLVYFPDGFGDGDDRANSVRRFTSLAYANGDAGAGMAPQVFANAYSNAIPGRAASTTFQYALDAEANALVSLANNAGTLETIGLVTVKGALADISALGGFDILSPEEGIDQAYAILQIDGQRSAGLYAIDLETGAASLLSDLGMGGFTGFAVTPAM
ncbi:MAG: DUF4394 domain-containing protein [Pseudomonadota bacterium]